MATPTKQIDRPATHTTPPGTEQLTRWMDTPTRVPTQPPEQVPPPPPYVKPGAKRPGG